MKARNEVRLFWCKSEGRKKINFNDTPFFIKETRVLDCQYGQQYYKQRPKQGKKMWLQGTRKIGCMAHVEIKTYVLYPQYAISKEEKEGLSNWQLRYLREKNYKSSKVA